MILKILLWINVSLFILHEMDAVRTREWKMMILFNRLDDNTGDKIFILLHLPLYSIIFYFMEYYFKPFLLSVSVLLIIHQFMHLLFRNHTENKMNEMFSKIVILLMTINSCLSIFYYFIF